MEAIEFQKLSIMQTICQEKVNLYSTFTSLGDELSKQKKVWEKRLKFINEKLTVMTATHIDYEMEKEESKKKK